MLQLTNGSGDCVAIPSCPYQDCEKCSSDFDDHVYCSACLNGFFEFSFGCSSCRYPCSSCSLNLSFVWETVVQPFWEVMVPNAYATNPNAEMPVFVNGFNFSNMSIAVMKCWTAAYFAFRAFQNIIPNFKPESAILNGIGIVAKLQVQPSGNIETSILQEIVRMVRMGWTASQVS
jgi:hypothetical protein